MSEQIWSYELEKHKVIKPGSLLLAEPFMGDENFKRAVILICKHDKDGTDGLLLNKPIKLRIQDLLNNFPLDFDAKLLLGGPVGTDTIQALHNQGQLLPESTKISDGVFWGGDFEQIKKHIRQGNIKTQHIRFYLGYSGWSAGQLDEELNDNSWIISEGANQAIFYTETNMLWQSTLNNMGGIYKIMANYPESPILN